MSYYSQIGIAIITKEKDLLDEVKEKFEQSSFYRDNEALAEGFLSLFQIMKKNDYYFLVIYEWCIRWDPSAEFVWRYFSTLCTELKLHWCWMRLSANRQDFEEDNNYLELNQTEDFLPPSKIFGPRRNLHIFI